MASNSNDLDAENLENVARSMENLSAQSSRLSKVSDRLSNFSERLSTLSERANSFKDKFDGLTEPLKIFGGYIDQASKLGTLSEEINMNVQSLQAWHKSAKDVGVGADQFNDSMKTFATRLGDAEKGAGPLTKALQGTNAELLENLKNAGSTEEAFNLYVAAMRQAGTDAEKSALASAGFSDANADMAKLAEISAEKFKKQRKELALYGFVNELGVKASMRFTEALKKFGLTGDIVANGVATSFVGNLIPAISDTLGTTIEFIDNNRELVDGVKQIVDDLSLFSTAFTTVGGAISKVLTPISHFASLLSGPVTSVISLISKGLFSLIGVMKSVGMAFLSNPIGIAIAAIGAAIFLLADNWSKVTKYFEEKIDRILALFDQGFLQGLLGIFEEFNPLVIFADAMDGLLDYLFGFDLYGTIDNLLKQALTLFDNFDPLNFISNKFNQLVDFISNFNLLDAASKAVGMITTAVENFDPVSFISTKFDQLVEFITNFDLSETGNKLIASLMDAMKSGVTPTLDWIKEKIASITNIFGKVKSFLGLGDDKQEEESKRQQDTIKASQKLQKNVQKSVNNKQKTKTESSRRRLSPADRVSQAASADTALAKNVTAKANVINIKSWIDVNVANAPVGTSVNAGSNGVTDFRPTIQNRGASTIGALAQ